MSRIVVLQVVGGCAALLVAIVLLLVGVAIDPDIGQETAGEQFMAYFGAAVIALVGVVTLVSASRRQRS